MKDSKEFTLEGFGVLSWKRLKAEEISKDELNCMSIGLELLIRVPILDSSCFLIFLLTWMYLAVPVLLYRLYVWEKTLIRFSSGLYTACLLLKSLLRWLYIQEVSSHSKCQSLRNFVRRADNICLFSALPCLPSNVKNPTLRINSMVIKSLNYDYSLSFNLTALLKISIRNRSFGYLEFVHKSNNTVSMIYGSGSGSVLGLSELKLQNGRIEWRDEEEIAVEMKVNSLKSKVNVLKDYDRMKLNSDLSSGSLELVGFASIKSNVYFVKNKIMLSTIAQMNCTIDIDLRKKSVQKLVC